MGCGHSEDNIDDTGKKVIRIADQEEKENYTYKVVLLGDVYVGKTSLLSTLEKQGLPSNYSATIGFAYSQKSFTLKNGVYL